MFRLNLLRPFTKKLSNIVKNSNVDQQFCQRDSSSVGATYISRRLHRVGANEFQYAVEEKHSISQSCKNLAKY